LEQTRDSVLRYGEPVDRELLNLIVNCRRYSFMAAAYDHHKKAGNQGDVVKHPALIAAVDTVLRNLDSQYFHFLDTFAGYAYNPLIRGNEWAYGIGHIHRLGRSIDNPNVNRWMSSWRMGRHLPGNVYLGSSLFVLKTCQDQDILFRGTLCDISPNVVAQLMTVFHQCDTEILTRAATPDDLESDRVDFVFIDPPGIHSDKNPQYPAIDDLIAFVDGPHHLMVWLPMVADLSTTPPLESDNSRGWRERFLESGLSATTVRWNAGGPICGCQLCYRLPDDAILAVREAIAATLTLTDWATKEVKHFEP
jgi:23S rRNA A2030 N6-methylase RlmJ